MPIPIEGMGHVVLPVDDMDRALGFYRDLLGFPIVGRKDPVWTVVDAHCLPLTLFLNPSSPRIALGPERDDSPFFLHVGDFRETARALETAGVRVQRIDEHQGVAWDPAGNAIGFHDHRPRPEAAGSRATGSARGRRRPSGGTGR
jgi:catechol 2,3-dioxygenase-like lactoylglutathione lyase family enzyme